MTVAPQTDACFEFPGIEDATETSGAPAGLAADAVTPNPLEFGSLSPLEGVWQGTGSNTICRPDFLREQQESGAEQDHRTTRLHQIPRHDPQPRAAESRHRHGRPHLYRRQQQHPVSHRGPFSEELRLREGDSGRLRGAGPLKRISVLFRLSRCEPGDGEEPEQRPHDQGPEREWWGEGRAFVSDSMRFGSWSSRLMTEYHIRYGGPGLKIYWHVERKSICIYSHSSIAGSLRWRRSSSGPMSTPTGASIWK